MRNKIIVLVVVLVVGAGAFYGGTLYAQSKKSQNISAALGSQLGQRQGRNFPNGTSTGVGANAGGFATGQIIAKDDKSIIIKLGESGSKIVFYSSTTQISKMASGTIEDLSVGVQITANGQANSDGSITAQGIQLRPEILQARQSPQPSNQ